MPSGLDLVLLARLDAEVTVYPDCTYTRHKADGPKAPKETLWKRPLRPMGRGGMGEVFREECIQGYNKGTLRAVKVLEKPRSAGQISYTRELEALSRFSQQEYAQWFVKAFGWFETTQSIFIAMELVEHGDLCQCLDQSGLPESETCTVLSQVMQGLSYMHKMGYTHRDLKPQVGRADRGPIVFGNKTDIDSQNLLVVKKGPAWHVKIADFGLSKKVTASVSSLRTTAGTPAFIAPEILGIGDDDSDDDEDRKPYTNAVDIWAVGVIAFWLLTAEFPFPARTDDGRILRRYVKGKIPLPNEPLRAHSVSAEGCAIIASFLAPIPSNRPTAEASLQYGWLSSSQSVAPVKETTTVLRSQASATWSNSSSSSDMAVGDQSPALPRATDDTDVLSLTNSLDVGINPQSLTRSPRQVFDRPRRPTDDTDVMSSSNSLDVERNRHSLTRPRGQDSQLSRDRGEQAQLYPRRFAKRPQPALSGTKELKGDWAKRRTSFPNAVLSRDGRLVATGGLETRVVKEGVDPQESTMVVVRVWDVSTGRELMKGTVMELNVTVHFYFRFSPNGRFLAVSPPEDTTVAQIWDIADLRIREFRIDYRRFHHMAWSSDSQFLAFAGKPRYIVSPEGPKIGIWLWSATGGGVSMRFEADEACNGGQVNVRNISFSPDGKLLAAWLQRDGSSKGRLRLWDMTTEKETIQGGRLSSLPREPVEGFAVSDALQTRAHPRGPARVLRIGFSADSKLLAVCLRWPHSTSWTFQLWDVATGRIHKQLETENFLDTSSKFLNMMTSPDGKLVAIARQGGPDGEEVRFWCLENGEELASLKTPGYTVSSVALLPDGKLMAAGFASQGRDKGLVVFETNASVSSL